MKRIGLTIIASLLMAASVLCVENSNTYSPLLNSATFTNRVTYITVQEAAVIETEAGTGTYTAPCHTLRAGLAASLARGPQAYTPVFAAHLITNINVIGGGALTGAGLTLDTPATDAALLASIASLWSTVAGCITNP